MCRKLHSTCSALMFSKLALHASFICLRSDLRIGSSARYVRRRIAAPPAGRLGTDRHLTRRSFQMSQLVLLGLESVPVHRQPACTSTRSRPTPHRRQQLTPCCSYEQDVYQRQRSPGAAPPLRSPPPPPPPPPLSKSDNGPRRNLLAGLFAIIGVAAGYKLSHDNSGAYKYTPQSGRPGRRWLYADANGTYDAETARQQERRPILRASGDVVDILRPSNDKFMRMHISQRDPHQMIMEGEMGEFYTLKPASDKVDVRRMDTLLKYFADPRWELGMRRSPIAVQQE